MADLSDVQAAQSVKLISSDSVGVESGAINYGSGAITSSTIRTAANNCDGAGTSITSTLIGAKQSLDVNLPQLGASSAPNTQVTPTANTSTTLLASNANRKWAIFSNFSGATFYLKFGQTAVVGQGITIANGAIYTMTVDGLFLGQINGIVASNSRTIDIIEGS